MIFSSASMVQYVCRNASIYQEISAFISMLTNGLRTLPQVGTGDFTTSPSLVTVTMNNNDLSGDDATSLSFERLFELDLSFNEFSDMPHITGACVFLPNYFLPNCIFTGLSITRYVPSSFTIAYLSLKW